jgi:carbonic anhydrase
MGSEGSPKCTSPIEIDTQNQISCSPLCDLRFHYKNSKMVLTVTDENVVLNYDDGSYISYNNDIFNLYQIKFTFPNAHRLKTEDGLEIYDGECHLWHRSDSGDIIVLAVFITADKNTSTQSAIFFNELLSIKNMKVGERTTVITPETWNAYQIIPSTKSFYKYQGSLISPPCTGNVTWIVFDNDVNMPNDVFNELKRRAGRTYSIKPLKNRRIYYNPNVEPEANKNYSTSAKCYTDEEIDSMIKRVQAKDAALLDPFEEEKKKYKIVMWILLGLFLTFILLYGLWNYSGAIKSKFQSLTNKSTTSTTNLK